MATTLRVLAGRYRVEGLIARGGMGEVRRGHDLRCGRAVALKLVGPSRPDEADRFVAESATLARLEHPALVRFLDAGVEDGEAYLVMELVDGPDLSSELAAGVPMDPCRAAEIGASLASALAYVHEHRIVHRDVKPANVLIGSDGVARLADFGIARLMDGAGITTTGTTIGTAAYMAPEQLEHHAVGPAADVYSLGLVLLECMTGKREYEGAIAEVAARRLCQDPVVPQELPVVWRLLLGGMLARDPLRRPTPAEVESVLGDAPAPAPLLMPVGPVAVAPTLPVAPTLAGPVAVAPTLAGPVAVAPTLAGPVAVASSDATHARGPHGIWRLLLAIALAAALAAAVTGLVSWLAIPAANKLSQRAGGSRRAADTRTAPATTSARPAAATASPSSGSSGGAGTSSESGTSGGPGGAAGRFLTDLEQGLSQGAVTGKEASTLVFAVSGLLGAYDTDQASKALRYLNQVYRLIQQGEERGSLRVALGNDLRSDLGPLAGDVAALTGGGSAAAGPQTPASQGLDSAPGMPGPGAPLGAQQGGSDGAQQGGPAGAPPGRSRRKLRSPAV